MPLGKWLAGSGSNRPHSRLTAGRAHPECYLPMKLELWCRATESNGIPPLFRRLCAAATPARRNWLRRRESNAPERGYEPRQTPDLTASRNGRCRGYRTLPFQAVRPVSRAYKAPPLTRADAPGSRVLERPAVIETALRDWQARILPVDDGPELVPVIWWTTRESNSAETRSCKDRRHSSARRP